MAKPDRLLTFFLGAMLLTAASPAPTGGPDPARLPDPVRLKATVEKLVSFGTRHTLSSPTDPKRGIGAARIWAANTFRQIGRNCGGCLSVEMVEQRFTGPRAPDGVNIVDVLAIQRGTGDPNDVILIAGHIDSRVTDIMDVSSDAPGANDDGSGTALVMEAARVLAGETFNGTIVYALLSGEEQGLFGGRLLADTAKARGWHVRAMLNNDIVGNTVGTDGTVVSDRVRVFSEGIRASEDLKAAQGRRAIGGEDDGPSRALARRVDTLAQARPDIGLEVMAVRRPDRFSRGGDQNPSLELGYPAIRFSVGIENYDRQHQTLRTVDGQFFGDTVDYMDFSYLARVTALNIATLRELASAPSAPPIVVIAGALGNDTTVTWDAVTGATAYRVYWRRADRQDWEQSRIVNGATTLKLDRIVVDDTFVGVAAVGPTGAESIVTFAGLPPPK